MNGVANGHEYINGEEGTKRSIVDIIGAGKQCVWNKKIKGTQLELFREAINQKYNIKLENYWDLHKWSVDNYGKFWEEIWNYFKIKSSAPYHEVVKNGKGFIDIDWFSGALFNYAENLLRFRDDHVALICADEEGDEEFITYAQMYEEVKVYAAAFKKYGLQKGDRVACYMSNRKEAIFAMLAAASMGGMWGGPLPFYGAKAASNIIKPMAPKFLFTCDRFQDNKIECNVMKNLPFIVNDLSSIEKVVIVPTKEESLSADISGIKNSCFLNEFLDYGKSADGTVPDIEFEQLPVNFPLFINFTSGTTGVPKGLVHSAGTLLPLLRDFGLHCDCTRKDVILTMYPVGWNLWNLFVANFTIGATVLLFNGNPFFLSKTSFWDLMSKYKVSYTFLVTSIVDKMEKEGSAPGPDCNLDNLKMITIGASPVKLQNFDYIYRNVKKDIFVGCLYGATEVIGVFSGFDFNEPAYSGEIQAPSLGLDLKCLDTKGNPVLGERGELVIGTPSIAFPVGVWGDNNKKRLNELYFSKYPGVWSQNDEAWIDPKTKGIVVVGRSDDTLNQNGERFGSADIYCAIHTMDELADYLCVGQDNINGDQRAVLFVKVKEGVKFNEELVEKIKKQVEDELTIEHVPAVVLEVKEIPYNLNNKRMERIIRSIIATNKVPEVANIKNPECLKSYCNIPELQNY